MAVGAAVAGAVSDALGAPAAVTRLPLTPERVLRRWSDRPADRADGGALA